MKQQLYNLLATFGYPVRLQGSLSKNESYPDSFFTFWNNSTDDGSHYDNDAIYFVWNFTIFFFSTDPAKVNTILDQVRTLFKSNGWIVNGKGSDAPSDEPSHTGRSLDVMYIENNSKTEENNDENNN